MKNSYLLFCLLVAGCAPKPTMPMAIQPSARVTVEQIGVIEDKIAYDGRRGVYLITDNKTGKEFIGISGIGIAETASHYAGKVMSGDER